MEEHVISGKNLPLNRVMMVKSKYLGPSGSDVEARAAESHTFNIHNYGKYRTESILRRKDLFGYMETAVAIVDTDAVYFDIDTQTIDLV